MLKEQVPTPSLIVDRPILERNIARMASFANEVGVMLRPHSKTHKNIDLAKLQLRAGAIGITCATIGEAEVMVKGGIHDIFVAYPLFGEYQLQKAAELHRQSTLTLAFDSVQGAERLSKVALEHGICFNTRMIINTGGNRDGVLAREARALGEKFKELPGLSLSGVMTHEGHVHQGEDFATMKTLATKAAQDLIIAAESLRELGFHITSVSSGATPACHGKIKVDGITEWRPGTYIFNDLNEIRFVASQADCALKVMAMVVSNPSPGRFILDAGSKVLSEAKNSTYGHGFIVSAPEARIVKVNEEHAIVEAEPGTFTLGQRVEIIPVHVCTVVNLSNGFFVEKEDQSLEYWPVHARGLVW